MPTTTGMKEGGFYDAHSHPQRDAIDGFLPWLDEAMASVALPADGAAVRLLDLGSSQGSNAIHAMQRGLQELRKRSTAPVWLFFCDLPTNDFNQLFANLSPADRGSILGDNVCTAAIGASAYEAVCPPGSIHLATSFNMAGWLDRVPAVPPGYILPMGPSRPRPGVGLSAAEKEPFVRQAADDLRRFYAARARELVPGGKLLLQIFGRDEQRCTSDGIYDVLNDALLDVVASGRLPRADYERLLFPVYFRDLEELLAPLRAGDLAHDFRIEQAATRETPVGFNVERARTGDVAAWARSYVAFMRAFTEPVLQASLPAALPVADIVRAVFARVEQRLRDEPDAYVLRYLSVGTLLTRL